MADSVSVGNENSAALNGKDTSEGSGGAAAGFAKVLSGSMNQNVDPNGQNSGSSQGTNTSQNSGQMPGSEDSAKSSANTLGNLQVFGSSRLAVLSQAENQPGQNAKAGSSSGEKLSSENSVNSSVNTLGNLQASGNALLAILTQLKTPKNPQTAQVSKKDQGAAVTGQNSQSSGVLASMLIGYGIFPQQVIQEAETGNYGSQTAGNSPNTPLTGSAVYNTSAAANLNSSSGSTADAELTKYKQVITDLLTELSGTIKDVSSNNNGNNTSLSGGLNKLTQDIARLIQGWQQSENEGNPTGGLNADAVGNAGTAANAGNVVNADTVVNAGTAANADTSVNTGTAGAVAGGTASNSVLNSLLSAYAPNLGQSSGTGKTNLNQDSLKSKIQASSVILGQDDEAGSAGALNNLQGTPATAGIKANNSAFMTGEQQKSKVLDSLDSLNPKAAQASLLKDGGKAEDKQSGSPTELTGGNSEQTQTSAASAVGFAAAGQIVTAKAAEGKTPSVPLWQQISSALSEQFKNNPQDLKQLDIQLHPDNLGKIQIDLHWENGQVHLQVQASQAETGQLLQNSLADLRQAPVSQVVNCGMLQMGQGGTQQQNSRDGGSKRMLNKNTSTDEEENSALEIAPLILEQGGLNQLNVTA